MRFSRDEFMLLFSFVQQYMNISITQHYHRHEYEINFYCKTMIDANSTERRFNYFRRLVSGN